jgi:hypothetical protein
MEFPEAVLSGPQERHQAHPGRYLHRDPLQHLIPAPAEGADRRRDQRRQSADADLRALGDVRSGVRLVDRHDLVRVAERRHRVGHDPRHPQPPVRPCAGSPGRLLPQAQDGRGAAALLRRHQPDGGDDQPRHAMGCAAVLRADRGLRGHVLPELAARAHRASSRAYRHHRPENPGAQGRGRQLLRQEA